MKRERERESAANARGEREGDAHRMCVSTRLLHLAQRLPRLIHVQLAELRRHRRGAQPTVDRRRVDVAHLDAVEALIHALLNFDGGLLVISHDEHLVSSICEELWVAEPGRVTQFKGEFAEYRRQQLKLTKKGLLPPMRPGAARPPVDVTDEAGDAAAASGTATATKQAKPKIEFVKNSR